MLVNPSYAESYGEGSRPPIYFNFSETFIVKSKWKILMSCISLNYFSGLDPAGPLFDKYHTAARLDASDAIFVDVIHTDTEGDFNLGKAQSW